MKSTLSVVVIAFNEGKNIRSCLESAKWADEIVVVDSGSTDDTMLIAKDFTDKIISKKWEGYSTQKQFALDQANCDWVLSLDADERISPELKTEIEKILANGSIYDGYKIPRKNHLLGRWIKSCFWYPDQQLRLFKKGKASVTDVKVHEGFQIEGEAGTLNGDIIHLTYQNFFDTFDKVNRYSTLAAEDRAGKKRIKGRDLVFHPVAAFLTDFISRKGYKDGVYGLMIALINMTTNLMMYMKMWEIQNRKNE
ncbi:MAG TPA: glycosyltransferase family 2 protein [Ignavibacteriaceae bacterium]|jgi:glycosyltransferase involved in cell wall biosynthesis|nr:glycosyltransferase family 2 protein [Ignavibacteriaceae bacterium]